MKFSSLEWNFFSSFWTVRKTILDTRIFIFLSHYKKKLALSTPTRQYTRDLIFTCTWPIFHCSSGWSIYFVVVRSTLRISKVDVRYVTSYTTIYTFDMCTPVYCNTLGQGKHEWSRLSTFFQYQDIALLFLNIEASLFINKVYSVNIGVDNRIFTTGVCDVGTLRKIILCNVLHRQNFGQKIFLWVAENPLVVVTKLLHRNFLIFYLEQKQRFRCIPTMRD